MLIAPSALVLFLGASMSLDARHKRSTTLRPVSHPHRQQTTDPILPVYGQGGGFYQNQFKITSYAFSIGNEKNVELTEEFMGVESSSWTGLFTPRGAELSLRQLSSLLQENSAGDLGLFSAWGKPIRQPDRYAQKVRETAMQATANHAQYDVWRECPAFSYILKMESPVTSSIFRKRGWAQEARRLYEQQNHGASSNSSSSSSNNDDCNFYYVGMTSNPSQRMQAHLEGRGCAVTQELRPVQCIFFPHYSLREAQAAEAFLFASLTMKDRQQRQKQQQTMRKDAGRVRGAHYCERFSLAVERDAKRRRRKR